MSSRSRVPEGADVVFTGPIRDADLPAFFHAADIVCSPALGGESFGIVLLEAMASGRPIVASRIEGYAALVDGIGCADLTPPGEPAALARAIVALIDEPDRRRRLGSAGASAASRYDWSNIATRLTGIYRRAIGERITAPSAGKSALL